MSVLTIAATTPVARREHRCLACTRTIAPGERYKRLRMLGEDGPYVWKECAHCRALLHSGIAPSLTELLDYCQDEGYGLDDIVDWRPETVAEARLKVQWRRKWRRRDGTLWPVPPTTAATEARP